MFSGLTEALLNFAGADRSFGSSSSWWGRSLRAELSSLDVSDSLPTRNYDPMLPPDGLVAADDQQVIFVEKQRIHRANGHLRLFYGEDGYPDLRVFYVESHRHLRPVDVQQPENSLPDSDNAQAHLADAHDPEYHLPEGNDPSTDLAH